MRVKQYTAASLSRPGEQLRRAGYVYTVCCFRAREPHGERMVADKEPVTVWLPRKHRQDGCADFS